jgi:hypothetical protein
VHGAPLWVTLNVRPAIVTVPVRDSVEVFAATVIVTEPAPDPFAPDVTVIHGALLTAVHGQPLALVTDVVVVPPAAATTALLMDSA